MPVGRFEAQMEREQAHRERQRRGAVAGQGGDGGRDRFEHIRQQRRWQSGLRDHPLADNNELLQAKVLAHLCARLSTHHDRLDPRQFAFEIFRESPEEHLANDIAEDRIAEEFKPLV